MKTWFFIGIIVFSLSFSDVGYAVTEQATFESFYVENSQVGWVLAGLFAIVAGAVIFFTGGAASPIVVGVGTWIGGLMGLSGAAATNAGLALLGGGAIASGGFGMVGGAALIAAALSFSTDVVFDYTAGKAISEYEYSHLVENSKGMYTLPLPKNRSGSDSYEQALTILDDVNEESLVSNNANKKIINRAINILEADAEAAERDEKTKNESLLALLYFVTNDYINAKKHAEISIIYADDLEIRRTVPAFIVATSSLYEENFNFTTITQDYFRHSVLAEPDNLLVPLMFSIYLDRMMLRIDDGYLTSHDLTKIFIIMKSPELHEFRKQNYVALLSRYFIRLKLEQQKIASFTQSPNKTIKNSPKTLVVVKNSLTEYQQLLLTTSDILKGLLYLDEGLDEAGIKVAGELGRLLISYREDEIRLKNLIDKLSEYQISGKGRDDSWSIYLIIFILIAVFSGYLINKKRTTLHK